MTNRHWARGIAPPGARISSLYWACAFWYHQPFGAPWTIFWQSFASRWTSSTTSTLLAMLVLSELGNGSGRSLTSGGAAL